MQGGISKKVKKALRLKEQAESIRSNIEKLLQEKDD